MGSTEGCGAEPPGTAGDRLGKGLDWPQPAQPGSTRDPDFGKCAIKTHTHKPISNHTDLSTDSTNCLKTAKEPNSRTVINCLSQSTRRTLILSIRSMFVENEGGEVNGWMYSLCKDSFPFKVTEGKRLRFWQLIIREDWLFLNAAMQQDC